MECQIKAEKARMQAAERQKEKEFKAKLETDLQEKERYLQESLIKQAEMEKNLTRLNYLEYQQKLENERLTKENALLEDQLVESAKHLQDSKSYINILHKQTKEEKQARARYKCIVLLFTLGSFYKTKQI